MEVIWVDSSIVAISPFGIDVPVSSKGIWFGTQLPGMEVDDKVELRQIL